MAAPELFVPTDAAFEAELTARTALKTGAVYWKIEVDDDFDTSYDDLTGYLLGNQVRIGGSGSIHKAATASGASFVLRNVPKVWSEGDLAGAPVKISVKIGSSSYLQIFTGYVSPQGVARQRSIAAHDEVTVECTDPSQSRAMARTARHQTLYTSHKICDTSAPASSIAHKLATELGLSAPGDLDFIDITSVKAYVFIQKGDSYWRELQDLALQYAAILGFRYDGKLRLVVWSEAEWNSPTSEYTFNSTNVHSINAIGSDVTCNRCRTEFENYAVLDAGVIHKNMTEWSETTRKNNIVLAAGEYWPVTTDEYAVARLQYERSGERFPLGVDIQTPTIGATGSGSDIEYTGGTLQLESFAGVAGNDDTKTTPQADSAEIILVNAHATLPCTITKLRLRGTPVRIKNRSIVQHTASGVDEWEIVEQQLPGKYAVSRATAEVACQRLVEFGKVARKRYEVVCDFMPQVQAGGVVTFNPTSDINMLAVVEAYEHASQGPHTQTRTKLTLVEHTTFTSSAGDSDETTEENAGAANEVETLPPAYSVDGLDQTFDGWDAIPDDTELFDLRQPDCASSEGRTPASKEIFFLPGQLEDELGNKYDNGMSRFAALGAVGVFSARTNLVTDPEDLTTSSWTNQGSTDAATSLTFQGRGLTQIIGDNSAAYARVRQTITVGAGVRAAQAVFRKGSSAAADSSTYFRLQIYEGATNRGEVIVPWDKSGASVDSGGASIVSERWYGDVCELVILSASCTGGSAYVYVVPIYHAGSNVGTSEYGYATAVMVENSVFAGPYTPTTRSDGELEWSINPPATGTVEFWFRPMFNYDTAAHKYIWVMGVDRGTVTNGIFFRYEQSTDDFQAWIYISSGAYRYVAASVVTSNADLWKWWHVKIVWDIPNQTIELYLDGTAYTSMTSVGTVSGLAFGTKTMCVGGYPDSVSTNVANGLICDLLYQPDIEDTSLDHYTSGMPWYDRQESANVEQTVRINQSSIRLHNASLTITDNYNRLIDISNRTGLLAKDAAGLVIHDVVNSPLLSGMAYGGHACWKETATYFASITLSYSDAATSYNATSSVTDSSLAGFMPNGLTNAHGALVFCVITPNFSSTKCQSGTTYTARARYATAYGGTPASAALMTYGAARAWASAAWAPTFGGTALIPVFWVSGVPYVTWDAVCNFQSMPSASGAYSCTAYLYFLGPIA